MPLTTEAEVRINGLLDTALHGLDDQVLVASGPCVDALLDLFGASTEHAVRQACGHALGRLGKVNLVRAADFRADLHAVAAAAASATIETGAIEGEQHELVEPAR